MDRLEGRVRKKGVIVSKVPTKKGVPAGGRKGVTRRRACLHKNGRYRLI